MKLKHFGARPWAPVARLHCQRSYILPLHDIVIGTVLFLANSRCVHVSITPADVLRGPVLLLFGHRHHPL